MRDKRLKRPRDPVELGKLIGDILTGQVQDASAPAPIDPLKINPPSPWAVRVVSKAAKRGLIR